MAAFKCKPANEMHKTEPEVYFKDILHKMNEYRKQGELQDVVLVVGERKFPAHRAVLSATCTFFEGLFLSEMKERQQAQIKLQETEPSVMEDLLNYLYTGEVMITGKNDRNLLQAADFLLLQELKQMAERYIESQLNVDNCVDIYILSDRHNCAELREEALQIIHTEFEMISKTGAFYQLSTAQMGEVIGSVDLVVKSEEIVYDALMRWVEQDVARERDFPFLFSHIRLHSLDKNYLKTKIECNELLNLSAVQGNLNIGSSQKGRKCFNSARKGLFLADKNMNQLMFVPIENQWYRNSNENVDAEVEIGELCTLFANGEEVYQLSCTTSGFSFSVINIIENKPTKLDTLPALPMVWFPNAVLLEDYLYVTGGFNEATQKVFADVQRFDCRNKTWSLLSPMSTDRQFHSLVSDGTCIYAIGGVNDNNEMLRSVECYNPVTNSWKSLPPMPAGRIGPQAIATKNYLLIFDGFDKERVDFDTWLVFSIHDNVWYDVTKWKFSDSRLYVDFAFLLDQRIVLSCYNKVSSEFNFVFSDICNAECDWQVANPVKIPDYESGSWVIALGAVCFRSSLNHWQPDE